METFFDVVRVVVLVWVLVSGVFVGDSVARRVTAAGGADGAAATLPWWRIGVVVVIAVALGLSLDDGPVLRPSWLQLVVFFAAPALVALGARCALVAVRRRSAG